MAIRGTKVFLFFGLALTAFTGLALAQETPFTAGKWTRLVNTPPFANGAAHPLLLTDGTVIVQDLNASDWWKLTPDNTGSYHNGTWSEIASLPSGYAPLYYGSAVLIGGRVIIEGGEYNNGSEAFTDLGAEYDPVANTWTAISPPPDVSNPLSCDDCGPGQTGAGDTSSIVLPNGQWMIANIYNGAAAIMKPSTCPPCTWTTIAGTGKADRNDEEGWTLLKDGTFVTVDAVAAPNAERFLPTMNEWINASNTVVRLEDPSSQEIGPATLLPSGKVFATGACTESNGSCTSPGHTSVYTPPTTLTGTGSWTAGPDFPNGLDIADGPATILTDGNVLVCTSPGLFNAGLTFFEYDGTNLNATANIPNASTDSSYYVEFLVLPTGNILETDFSNDVEIYAPSGTYNAAWAPTITSYTQTVTRGSTYTISGTQFNGVSEGATYGDDAQMRTNYPLVRVTNNASGHVKYFRTHNHSTMGVQTGSTTVSTEFDVPSSAETGASSLVVVANGIPSKPVSITVQ